jgi:hypothetical protein
MCVINERITTRNHLLQPEPGMRLLRAFLPRPHAQIPDWIDGSERE